MGVWVPVKQITFKKSKNISEQSCIILKLNLNIIWKKGYRKAKITYLVE